MSLQSDQKSLKREKEKQRKPRYWYVRGIDKELESYRYWTVTFPPRSNALFSEMYRYYCAAEFPLGTVTMRRISCSCATCDAIIKLPWDPDIIDIKHQLRF